MDRFCLTFCNYLPNEPGSNTMSNTITNLVGILELSCGKTYGRQQKNKGKEGKLFYGIYHEYENLPYFKVAYEIKHSPKDISRFVKDKYVIFNYDKTFFIERPEAKLIETIGDVDDEQTFAKYRTLKSGLKLSSSWTKELLYLRKQIEQCEIIHNSINLCQTHNTDIFTIDPEGCKDMDDGVGIKSYFDNINETKQEICDISIAITNVPAYLVSSNLSSDCLINSLSNTCSIYLPNNVINMIPKIFAEQICSFIKDEQEQEQENKTTYKPALVLHIIWNNSTNIIVKQELKIENVIVKHNFVYDTQELLTYKPYIKMFDVIKKINNQKTFDACQTINDSHDVVAYLMTYMNFYVMEWLENRHIPCIYRINRKRNIKQLPQNLKHLERKIGNYSGEYVIDKQPFTDCNSIIWTHITSPMRRLADLTNMISISFHLYPKIYEPLKEFRDYCLTIVSRINHEYKSSRRVGLDCDLFSFIKTQSSNTDISNKIFQGIIIENEYNQINNRTNTNNYIVYIEELSRMFEVRNIEKNYNIYDNVNCRIIMFEKGYNIKQKVRVMIL